MATKKLSVGIRLDPDIKEAATRRAKSLQRSVASYVEWLIAEDVRANPVEPVMAKPRASRRGGLAV